MFMDRDGSVVSKRMDEFKDLNKQLVHNCGIRSIEVEPFPIIPDYLVT